MTSSPVPTSTRMAFQAIVACLCISLTACTTAVTDNSKYLPSTTQDALPSSSYSARVRLLQELSFSTKDGRAAEDSRSIELTGKAGSGVTAVEIWSSCDDDTHRIKSFKAGQQTFTYNISPALGNVCRGSNDYFVRAIGKADGKDIQLEESKQTLNSFVGVRHRQDVPVLKFLEEHALPASKSIEDTAALPARLLPSLAFRSACGVNEEQTKATPEMRIGDGMMAGLEVGPATGEVKRSAKPPHATMSMKSTVIQWFDMHDGGTSPSATILPLSVGICDDTEGFEIVAPARDRAFVTSLKNGTSMFFDGSRWMDIEAHLLQSVPVPTEDLGRVRLAVGTSAFAIIETTESRVQNYAMLFPDQRGEYLFSLTDGSFLGVVWHRKR